uniref:Ig-like domain-containing protein n=1 Tax=Methanobrevibacter sp. TaxID=66852 RepID=UPI00386D3A0D
KVNKDSYKITGNKNIAQYYGATKTYKIRLTNNNQPVKNEIITIKLNKNTVKIKTDNQGYASLKLNLKAGKYTITATYKNVKVSNKIKVKPTLITKDKKIKKGKTLTYTAKLLNKNGKPLKNKKITFKIKNKKYTAKTNKKGIAKIKIKNLKKGKHKITTTYKKQKNKNTITVK